MVKENYLFEEIYLIEDNRYDKSYLSTSFWDNHSKLRIQREAYLLGKVRGFHIGVEAYKPTKLMIELGKSCKDSLESKFYQLFYLFCERFGIGIVFHPNEGMIFTKVSHPREDESSLFNVLIDEEFKTVTKSNVLQELHLKIEQFSNKELSNLIGYINYEFKERKTEKTKSMDI